MEKRIMNRNMKIDTSYGCGGLGPQPLHPILYKAFLELQDRTNCCF